MILIISPTNAYATARLKQEFVRVNQPVRILSVSDLDIATIDIRNFDMLYVRQAYPQFETVLELAKKFRDAGKYVVDGPLFEAGFETGKDRMYTNLEQLRLPIPITRTLAGGDTMNNFPFILKWMYGFGGKDVFLINNENDLQSILPKHPTEQWLVQEYIPASREFEVYVIGFVAVPKVLMFKTHDGFKANAQEFTSIQNSREYFLYNDIINVAEKAARSLGREIAKVDIIESHGKIYVLEVNRSPGLVSFESLIGYNITELIARYLLKRKDFYEKSNI